MSDQTNDLLKTERIKALFSDFETTYDHLPAVARNEVILSLTQKKLQDKNAVIELNEQNELVLKRRDGANVFGDDHRQWDVKTLIRKALSESKILKEQKSQLTSNPVTTVNKVSSQPIRSGKPNTLKDLVDRSLNDLKNSYRH